MDGVHTAASGLRSLLRDHSTERPRRWRAWADELMRSDRLSPTLLAALWEEILDFDPVLATYVASPVPVPKGTVLVAGSGKETIKTFNVSTAASVLAASAGVSVVKGVSRSVSAVSGAADALTALGIPIVGHPDALTEAVVQDGIAAISYAAFCPHYAERYDGTFPVLNPFSFFMPIAVLAADAARYVYGIAHRDVALAGATLRRTRPELRTGFVVATETTPGAFMDEHATVGTTYTAILREQRIELDSHKRLAAPESWHRAVAHRSHHAANAHAVTDALSPHGDPARTTLAEHNAALIVRAAHDDQLSPRHALELVQAARRSGHAAQLLTRLQDRKEPSPHAQRTHAGEQPTSDP